MGTPIAIAIHIAALLVLALLSVLCLTRLKSTKRERLVLFSFCVFLYVLGSLVMTAATSTDAGRVGIWLLALGGLTAMPTFYSFAQHYCERKLPVIVDIFVYTLALLFVTVVWTSDFHDLIYIDIYMYPEGCAPGIRCWAISEGALHSLIFAIYPAICGIIALSLFIWKALNSSLMQRRRLVFFIAITAIPVGGIMLDSFGINFQGMYNTILTVPIATGIGYIALYKFDLLENEETIRSRNWLKDMIANISHDIKTPLTIMSVNIEKLLYAYPDDKDFSRDIQIAYNRNLDLQRLVQNLIDITRIDAAQNLYSTEWIPVNDILSEIQSKYGDYLDSVGLYLDITAHGGNAYIQADTTRIWSVFDNVIYNAARHTTSGGITIAAKSGARLTRLAEDSAKDLREGKGLHGSEGRGSKDLREGDGTMDITVSDTGSGISPQHLPHIYDRFYKADANDNARTGETGIGLFIVKNTMENFGGNVDIDSTVGKGTVVKLTFKKIRAHEAKKLVKGGVQT